MTGVFGANANTNDLMITLLHLAQHIVYVLLLIAYVLFYLTSTDSGVGILILYWYGIWFKFCYIVASDAHRLTPILTALLFGAKSDKKQLDMEVKGDSSLEH